MATVIFDFDSTVISCESLEEILAAQLAEKPQEMARLKELTEQGMSGNMTFEESLQQRLALASPTYSATLTFAENIHQWLTAGIDELISSLSQRNIEVWLISGGIREVLLAAGKHLKIPAERIHAVQLQWDSDGQFLGVDTQVAFCRSKTEGARSLVPQWSRPTIVVGDGMTDYALYEEGMADHFIAYTEHCRRPALVKKASHIATNVQQLQNQIDEMIRG